MFGFVLGDFLFGGYFWDVGGFGDVFILRISREGGFSLALEME